MWRDCPVYFVTFVHCRRLYFTRVGWKIHRLTKKELCHSNETWHALNSIFADTLRFLNHSEVKFVCVRLLCFRTWVRHWSLRRKIWISHQPIPNVQTSSHSQSLRQSLCWCIREHQIACGDWLVRQTTSVCNSPITCTAWIKNIHVHKPLVPMPYNPLMTNLWL